MAWTYLLECRDGTLYVDSTTNLETRLAEHQAGTFEGYTSSRRPLRLLWAGEFEKINEAYAFERKLHGWSRVKKLALAHGELQLLPALASRSYPAQDLREALRRGPFETGLDGPPQGPGTSRTPTPGP